MTTTNLHSTRRGIIKTAAANGATTFFSGQSASRASAADELTDFTRKAYLDVGWIKAWANKAGATVSSPRAGSIGETNAKLRPGAAEVDFFWRHKTSARVLGPLSGEFSCQ